MIIENDLQLVEPGDVLRHFKGGTYVVRCVAQHASSPEQLMVVYESLWTQATWVRALSEFFDDVERDGVTTKRFTKQSRSRGTWMRLAASVERLWRAFFG